MAGDKMCIRILTAQLVDGIFNIRLLMTNFSDFIKKIGRKINFKGLANNPLFCFKKKIYIKRFLSFKNGNLIFGILSIFLFTTICYQCNAMASLNGLENKHIVFFNSFFDNTGSQNKEELFVSQSQATELEPPELKIIQDNTLGGVAVPYIVSTKVLGNVFGGNSKRSRAIVEYVVQPGDTFKSISTSYDIAINTLLWANDLTSSSKIKVGQSLVILPTDGLLHLVKSGDTMDAIAKKYSALASEIISYNELASQEDIYVGDILIIPNGVMPKKAVSINNNNQTVVASSYFINPTYGKITQGIHYYNAIDVANKCGTPIYAASSGTVQRVKYGYNFGGGNLVTILHSNGTVTYYGHLMTIFVKPGDKVGVGERIALMGGGTGTVGDGLSTGCHLHFQVMGAKNPLSIYYVGSTIKLK
jgi:LysM repeat protein